MAEFTINDLDDEVYRRLSVRAKLSHRTLEAEVCAILEHADTPDRAALVREIDDIRERSAGKHTGDSTAWIREDRDKRR